MSRPALLSAYEKLAALLGRLPGSLQQPILRELDPIKEIFLRQRPPRIALLGDMEIGVPALLNALAGRTVVHAPLASGVWNSIRGAGVVEVADLRSPATIVPGGADIYLYLANARESAPAAEAARAAEVLAVASPREDGSPAGLAVLVLGGAGDDSPVLSALAGAGASQSVVFSLPIRPCESGSCFASHERSALGDRVCDYLPEDAQLETARFLGACGAQARLAATVLKAFGAVAAIVGVQPIPLADFPLLMGLQVFMVSLIIYTSGRAFSTRLAAEFAASLGVNFGAGLLFREAARAVVKVLPVWGNFISGGVAGAGTYALGRAAIAYFIEGKPWASRETLRGESPRQITG